MTNLSHTVVDAIQHFLYTTPAFVQMSDALLAAVVILYLITRAKELGLIILSISGFLLMYFCR